ncbi:Epsin ent1 2 [Cordyceps militaris]|uniref:Epsin ent1 2 n=1 Tax=Cordyceps militaris TaxID=73501 RepID=A0A2H4SUV5_CORMI|nr:Epsin ent1 2 [Cordyceps militaris]
MSKVMRSIKNVTHGYSSIQAKVREATSNDPWGPTGTQMSEIAQMTFNTSTEFYEIMDMLDKRLNDKGKNWRHVLKALKVLDYCLHEGSELVVTWARQSLYVIKTLREFQYIDEDGRDVGQNVRVAAKELTSLVLDEERLRAERTDRKSWKSRVTGLEEHMPEYMASSSHTGPRPNRRPQNDEEDAEYRLALEASKAQEEEDRKKRESRQGVSEDPDLQKALKLSKEEEERRRRDLEDQNANSLFGFDEPAQASQPQPTGLNQGYQQGNQVNFMGNPIDQNQMMGQPTGYMQNPYQTGMMPNQTGFPNYNNIGMQQTGMGMDPYGQQQQHQSMPSFQQPQATGFNPYAQQQMQLQQPSEPSPQPGSNNPWATNQSQQSLKPMQTGSNNPFAQFNNRPQTTSPIPTLAALPEQKTLSAFGQQQQFPQAQPQPQMNFGQSQAGLNSQPKKELSEHESRLNALLASGDGMDTYGNTGDLRIPAQHTAPGMFMNSAGSGAARLQADATGNNPFMRQQFTGMPSINYGGQNGQQINNNPFGAQQPQRQQQQPGHDLIQF